MILLILCRHYLNKLQKFNNVQLYIHYIQLVSFIQYANLTQELILYLILHCLEIYMSFIILRVINSVPLPCTSRLPASTPPHQVRPGAYHRGPRGMCLRATGPTRLHFRHLAPSCTPPGLWCFMYSGPDELEVRCVADSVLVLRPSVRPEPLRWDRRVQDIEPPETSWLHVISICERSPRNLHLSAPLDDRQAPVLETPCQTTSKTGTQPHPLAERLPKIILGSQTPQTHHQTQPCPPERQDPAPPTITQGTGTSPLHQEAYTAHWTNLTHWGQTPKTTGTMNL